ncbi:hypothetical protein [Clostridium baratii]|uniref:hypothetical protein n=1 Tax=Clostridium baratii TaxID=1561 RepID=UPI0030CBD3A8
MYCNLEAEIVRKKIKRIIIAKSIKKSYNTLNLKIAGKSPFTYDEAIIIQEKFFPEIDLKELFKKTEMQQNAS